MATKAEKQLLVRKVWVIQEIGWEYNDEYYYLGESQGGKAQKAYLNKDQAYLDCAALNESRLKLEERSKYPMQDSCGHNIKDFYEVVEVEAA